MIKVTDFIAKRITEHGIRDVFMISGGGAMHLNDSLGNCPGLNYWTNHHEQACAIAAEGYYRAGGRMAAVNVTTGPGGLNCLTGLMGQWTDSIPVLYLSGQVKFETTVGSCPESGLRQLGDQEVDIIPVVRPLTKFAVSLTDPGQVKKVLDKALFLANHQRKGPVWVDIPMNIQGALVDESNLEEFDPVAEGLAVKQTVSTSDIEKIAGLLTGSKRPVLIAGHGIRLAGAIDPFMQLVNLLGIPVLTTFNGIDLMPGDHPNYGGRIGTLGNRSGNFALQNADVIICIGTRNNIRQVSYNWQNFGHRAVKVIVDIDPAELLKPTLKPDIPVQADAGEFCTLLAEAMKKLVIPDFSSWMDWVKVRLAKYPVVLPEYQSPGKVHPYYFIRQLTLLMGEKGVLVAGNGTACVAAFQAAEVKKGQRLFWNSGCASMGYDIPAALGASIGGGGSEVICLAGDGSIQMNIQELQTISQFRLPVKIFYLNNEGYISIKQTQDNFFNGRRVACDANSKVSFPEITKLAEAYGIPAVRLQATADINRITADVLKMEGPVICEVLLRPDYIFKPKVASEKLPDGRMVSKPLEDMFPFLDRDDYNSNML